MENKIKDTVSTIKKLSKTPRVNPENLLDWVKPNSLELSLENKVLFQSKQNKFTRFKCDGSGDFAGAMGLIEPQLCLITMISKT